MHSNRIVTFALAGLVCAAVAACGSDKEPAPATVKTTHPSQHESSPTPDSTPGVPAPTTVTKTTNVPMMPNPNGDGSMVPCEGTICTNPNHGGGDNPYGEGDAPPEPGQTEMQGPRGDAPPEPGQTDLQGSAGDAPPEPGQTDLQG